MREQSSSDEKALPDTRLVTGSARIALGEACGHVTPVISGLTGFERLEGPLLGGESSPGHQCSRCLVCPKLPSCSGVMVIGHSSVTCALISRQKTSVNHMAD